MLEIKMYNDGKENWQSYEASLDCHSEDLSKLNIYSLDVEALTGYGADASEAKDNLLNQLRVLSTYLCDCYRALAYDGDGFTD